VRLGRPGERGQAAAELVATLPILIAILLATGQLAVVGYALWTAGQAAGSGARAAHVGGDADAAARSALPDWLEDGALIDVAGPVEVEVRAPALLPGVPDVRVRAAADLDPAGAGDE
jgi:hypothetical protein